VEAVTVTPSVFYQNRNQHQNDRYWVGASNPGNHQYANGTPDRQADLDHFTLASLKIEAQLGGVTLVSDSSYFNRKEVVNGYSGTIYNLSLFQQLLTNPNGDGTTGQNFNLDPYTNDTQAASAAGYPLLGAAGPNLPQFPGYVSRVFITNKQENYTQELRLQSSDPAARFSWVAGVFFQQTRQVSVEEINDPQLPQLVPLLFGGDFLSFTEGLPLLPNGDDYINSTTGKDRQIALFADATFAITPRLKVTAGVRYAWTKYSFTNFADGPQNVGFGSGSGGKSEQPFTPKAGLSFQATRDDLYYFTAAKGFRIGGANPPIPVQICAADLQRLGSVPNTYDSDNVWSYEIGSKNRFFGRRLSFAGSAYYLEWNNIQQASYLTSCGFQYTGNFGTVHSRGFDAQVNWTVTRGLDLDLAVGYTDAHYAKTTQVSPGLPPSTPDNPNNLSAKSDTIAGVAPWTVTAGLQYSFKFNGNDAFVRSDYEYRSHNPHTPPLQNPLSAVNDLLIVADPETAQVNIRAGMTIHQIEAEAFINNLANVHPQLALAHEDQYTALFEAQTFRPRTFGLSLSYRY
jgi:iron complex outermembrane receptor protein